MSRKQIFLILFLGIYTHLVMAGTIPEGSWNVIPHPQQVTLTGGSPFTLTASTTIRVSRKGGSEVCRCARFLKDYIRDITGVKVKITTRRRVGQIALALTDSFKHAEAYRIKATPGEVSIVGSSGAGLFHGVQTLRKALPMAAGATAVTLPSAEIADYPRFGYRGFLLDVGRHFFSFERIKTIIDELALHNINYFHWHLTEDQGWRLAVDGYPRLTTIGSHRIGSQIQNGTVDTIPVSGYYTKSQVREIVKYAADRFITIIPEIDMPGHMSAALASYPELGCTGGPYKVQNKWGVFPDVLCAGNPATLKFVKDVLAEVLRLFPSPYIHLGGDECPKERWKQCPKCQARIEELHLTDEPGHSREEQLQTWFMQQAAQQVTSHGRHVMGWSDVLKGKPDESMTVLAWTGPEAVSESARRGYSTIVCPISNFYLSDPYSLRRKGRDSFSAIYDYPVVPSSLTPAQARHITGVEGCIWTEWVSDEKELQRELLPRLAALAEVQWTQPQKKNLDRLLMCLPHMEALYRSLGFDFRTDLFD